MQTGFPTDLSFSPMGDVTRTSRSRTVSAASSRSVSSAPTSREQSVASSEQPIEIFDDEEEQTYASELVGVLVEAPENFDRDQYLVLEGEHVVHTVLHECDGKDGIMLYNVRFEDNHTEVVSLSPAVPASILYCVTFDIRFNEP
jgi:hypothetical protein